MKKLLMLLMVSFSFAMVNAQETTKTEVKSCTKSKAACDKAKAEGKTCDKSAEGKTCDKSKAKSCDKSKAEGKACCDKSKTTEAKSCCDKSKSSGKSCSGSSAAYSKTINAKDFMSYADRFPAENLIDIRTKKEVLASGMIDGATNIDYNGRDFKEKINALDKDAAIMIYCASGRRSGEAISLLKSWGFKKIYNLDGGYKAYLATFPAK